MKESHKYWYVLPILLFEYAILISSVVYCRKRKDSNNEWFSEKRGRSIADSAIKGTYSKYILLGVRIIFFLWLLIAPVGVQLSEETNIWTYFTYWTVYFHTLYFAAAVITTILILLKENGAQIAFSLNQLDLDKTSLGLSVIFETTGTSSIFIACVNYIMLSQNGEYRNTILHAVPPGLLLIELFLNDVHVELPNAIIAMSYPMLYLVVIFGVVVGNVRRWPYDFVNIETPGCFVWYNILFIVFMIFFVIWYGLCRFKYYWYQSAGCGKDQSQHQLIAPDSPQGKNTSCNGGNNASLAEVEMGRPSMPAHA